MVSPWARVSEVVVVEQYIICLVCSELGCPRLCKKCLFVMLIMSLKPTDQLSHSWKDQFLTTVCRNRVGMEGLKTTQQASLVAQLVKNPPTVRETWV